MPPKVLYQQDDQSSPENISILELLNTLLQRQDGALRQVQELQEQLNLHLRDESVALQTLVRALPSKPDGTPDVDGHREYHASLIEEAKARTEFWRDLRMELLRKGLWGLLGAVGFLIMFWWTKEVRR
jgi:hypothetical protein